MYQNPQNTFSFSLSANRIGDRLYAVGNIKNPDVYEKGRTVIDFQISKSFKTAEDIELKLNVKDILAQKALLYENSDGKKGFTSNMDFIRMSRQFGRIISLTFTYKF